uniref:Lymphotoxin-alpha n=1 Tax=Hemibarbus labeo TaxID=328524 RepID=A0A5H2PEJ9_9TELE|nr:tumor necrosis factor alpha [Hemibarbus labeo]
MVNYETTIVDLEASTGGVYQTTVAPVPVKSSRSWIWKTVAAVTFLCLCATAAFLFTLHTMPKPREPPIFSEKEITTPSGHGTMLKQIAENTKAAIHLHGERGSPNSHSLKWVSGVDQSFAQGGLKLDNNEIHIPADGLYFVYSQVSYAIQCNKDKGDDDAATRNFLSHSIWRYTDAVGKSMPLQNSAQSVCQSHKDEKSIYSTIYLGAVFQLNEDDRLSTRTYRAADVEEDYAKTFFGVFAL